MTDAFVVDASAFVAVMLDEPESGRVTERLSGHQLIAPALLYFEVANVMVIKSRRRPENMQAYIEAYEKFGRVAVEIVDVDFVKTISIAQRRNLSAYDASYLWLALSRGLELVSLDKKLLAAFEAERNAIN